MRIYLLDMGEEKYGDCIVCVGADRTILIDGGHSGDIRRRGDTDSIPDQLTSIVGPHPFSPDLLIVTHCHADHIGCLPAMIAQGIVTPKAALVADPDLGFGTTGAASDGTDSVEDRLVAALREEPHDDLESDQAVATFMQDAVTLESRYRGMLKALEDNGVRVVRYKKREDGAEFERQLASLGLKILGPSADHLEICGDAIKNFVAGARTRVRRARAQATDLTDVDLYRMLSSQQSEAQDMPGKGAALNDESIVVAVSDGGQSALLTGDMQFVKPEQPGIDDPMQALRKIVVDAGPYAMVKLAHHGSYNGTDATTLRDFGASVLTISGGRNDPGHPDPGTLTLLAQQKDIVWARTDRNGLITCDLDSKGAALTGSRGQFNDASPNTKGTPGDTDADATLPALVGSGAVEATTGGADVVEIVARVPHVGTRVTITIDVAPQARPREQSAGGKPALTAPQAIGGGPKPSSSPRPGRPSTTPAATLADLEPYKMRDTGKKLLFVTAAQVLATNIGNGEARLALGAIAAAGHTLVDVATPNDPYPDVRKALAQGRFDGVVVLGGYDVLPSSRMDVLDPTLRQRISNQALDNDADSFIVWNDQLYGDIDGDQLGELPVSRIPDGHSADLVRAALIEKTVDAGNAFGLRNAHRPFARAVFQGVPRCQGDPITSNPQLAEAFVPLNIAGSAFYLMLHGSYYDATRFWGEEENGDNIVALDIGNVPASTGATVFAGCCWGALTVRNRAVKFSPGDTLQAFTPDQSIALRFLQSGANAFVGCTGSHYSPLSPEPTSASGPLHVAFWQKTSAGLAPAPALFAAKKQYAAGIPHVTDDPDALAVEAKTLRQFTCLGLGW